MRRCDTAGVLRPSAGPQVSEVPEVPEVPAVPTRSAGAAPASLVARLVAAGCVAAEEEAAELVAAAEGRAAAAGAGAGVDQGVLEGLVARRVAGEPLAWVTGSVWFLGHRVRVDPGVYVPRWQSEALARRAVELLPDGGLAADLCTGAGAIAVALARARPTARVVATDADPAACRCAAANGAGDRVEVLCGDLAAPVPAALHGRVDVVVAVAPYVPSDEIGLLPREARDHEPLVALDGGPDGLQVLRRLVRAAARLLRPGGSLLAELGGEQDRALAPALHAAGFDAVTSHHDGDGDLRGVEARRR